MGDILVSLDGRAALSQAAFDSVPASLKPKQTVGRPVPPERVEESGDGHAHAGGVDHDVMVAVAIPVVELVGELRHAP
jgi:hypothetical protein